MTRHLDRDLVADRAIVRETFRKPVVVDRSFEMPRALYGATVALYLGFVAVMALGFSSPGLIIPLSICVIFIGMVFGVPSLWARIKPEHGKREMTIGTLMRRGIATNTGRLAGRDAAAQMLVLPVLIFLLGLATVTIAAMV